MSVVTVTDMFCGTGGSSQGAVAAGMEVRMAANHWELAIRTHNTNFPQTDHDCADINQVDPRRWPRTTILWASPDGIVMPFVLNMRGNDGYARGANVDEPMPTVTTSPPFGLVMPFITSYYGRGNINRSMAEPMATIPTVDHHALVRPEAANIDDCYFRMLKPPEIGRGQAFADNYIVLGNSRQKVRQYGNAVNPPVATWLFVQVAPILG